MTSDEHLALAYWCIATNTLTPIRDLPAADRITIYSLMADIRAEHGRTAAGLVGGRRKLDDLLDRITSTSSGAASLPQPHIGTVGAQRNDPGTAQTVRGPAETPRRYST